MKVDIEDIDPFQSLGALAEAWAEQMEGVIKDHAGLKAKDGTTFKRHEKKAMKFDACQAFGYVARLAEKAGSNGMVFQSKILQTLEPDCAQERQRLRQDMARRYDALEFFGLVHRDQPQPNVVILSLTKSGRAFREAFNRAFHDRLHTRINKETPQCSNVA